MEPRAGDVAHHVPEDRQVAGNGAHLGRGRPAAQPENGRHEPVVRLGALGRGGVLRVVDDRQPGHAGVGQGVAQDLWRAHGRAVVREAHDTGVAELTERRKLIAPAPGSHRAVGEELDRRAGGGRRAADSGQHARLVERRVGVGHGADRREPAMGRRREPARDRLGVLVAGLAQVHVQVDEAGRDHDAARVDAVRVGTLQPGHRFERPSRTTISAGPSRPLSGSTAQTPLRSSSAAIRPTSPGASTAIADPASR